MSEEEQQAQETEVVEAQEKAVEEQQPVEQPTEDQKVEEQKVEEQTSVVSEDLSDEEIDKSDAPQSLKTALKRSNRRLRRERQARAKLEERVNSFEDRFSKIDSQQESDSLLKEMQDELGLDTDQTKKLYNAVDRVVASRLKDVQQGGNQPAGNLTPKQAEFVQKSSKEMSYYPEEDRGKLSQYAQKAIEAEMRQLESLGLDPNDALDENPKVYISRGYKQMVLEQSTNSRLNQQNEHARAATESSRNGSKAPGGPQKMTQALFDKNRGNSKWVAENRQAILDAARQGIIRGR